MSETLSLIDSDILIAMLRRNEAVCKKGWEYLKEHGQFNISILTYYECLRGYKKVNASRKLQLFHKMIEGTNVIDIDYQLLEEASNYYAFLHPKGLFRGEFDLLIGTTALMKNYTLITNNQKHYLPLQTHFGLRLDNWFDKNH